MKRTNQLRSIAILVGITATSICIGQNVNTPTTGGGQVVNNLTKWTNVAGPPFTINNSQITDNGTNVDIATPSIGLGAVLNVHGFDANTGNVFSTNCPGAGGIESKWSIYKANNLIGYINSDGAHLGITASQSILFTTQNITNGTRMFLYENGNVGIGHWTFIWYLVRDPANYQLNALSLSGGLRRREKRTTNFNQSLIKRQGF